MIAGLVKGIITIVAAIIIIVFAIFIIKDIIEIIKGGGSPLRTIGKVFFVFLMIGVIYSAQNYDSIGNAFSGAAQEAIEGVAEEADDLFK